MPVEQRLRRVPGVEQAALFGNSQKSVIAVLVVPDVDQEAGAAQTIVEEILQDVGKHVADLPGYQRPAGLVLTPHPFTVASGELTANMKLRRQKIYHRYAPDIEAVYAALAEEGAGQPIKVVWA